MWYRCEALGQSNIVHQLQLFQKIMLMKNWILCRHVKIKKRKLCIINHIPWLKCLYFLCFWVREIIKRSKYRLVWRNLILGKICCFYQKRKWIFEKFWFCYTWPDDHIQQVFQISERSDQYSRRYDILKLYPSGIALCSMVSIQNNVITIGLYLKKSYLLEYWSDRYEIWKTCWIWS